MEDLLRYQIHESCTLALPEGLKELMSDISREVLRAQPNNMCKFIADYLSTLLITRENLSIAARVCDDVWDCSCYPELEDELQDIGLDEEDINIAKQIIEKFFKKGPVNEGKILVKLVEKTSLSEDKLPEVLDAIRKAFLRHQRNRTQIYEISSNSDEDDTTKAVRHTLQVYRKTQPSNETYNIMARKIQASYRAYRARVSREKEDSEQFQPMKEKQTAKKVHSEISKVTFGPEVQPRERNGKEDLDLEESASINEKNHLIEKGPANPKNTSVGRISSISLAGSYMSLPAFEPYSAHHYNSFSDLQEMPEKERANFDYTRHQNKETDRYIHKNANNSSIDTYEDTKEVKINKKPTDVEDTVEEAEDLSEASIEENILGEDIEMDLTNYDLENDLKNEEDLLGEGLERHLTNYEIENELKDKESKDNAIVGELEKRQKDEEHDMIRTDIDG